MSVCELLTVEFLWQFIELVMGLIVLGAGALFLFVVFFALDGALNKILCIVFGFSCAYVAIGFLLA